MAMNDKLMATNVMWWHTIGQLKQLREEQSHMQQGKQ